MSSAGTVRVTFFGGVGEIGKNMSIFESAGCIIVVDCGAKFPENDQLGVDLVIPDYTYLEQNQDRIAAVILTHGHEDHVGGLPYFLGRIQPPVIYGTRLTLGLVEAKLAEFSDVSRPSMEEVAAGDTLSEGPFEIELLHVNHSIPDSVGLALRTPAGIIIHTADFKFDQTPIGGRPLDSGAFARYGQDGVRLLISDSTNAERPGYVASERLVGETFLRLLDKAPGRVIIATFASNIHRVQQVLDASQRLGRKVVVDGRSMAQNVEMATRLGYLTYPQGLIISADEMSSHEPDEITIVTTGSQGEPTSALTRMAVAEHKKIEVEQGDTVVLSATPIPGNEELIWRTVNNLFRLGATVIYTPHELVHVSGHGNQEELKLMLSLTKPEHVLPYHGEPRHQHTYGRLAATMGVDPGNVHTVEPYQTVEVSGSGVKIVDRIPGEAMLVDGSIIGDVKSKLLRERRLLAEDGVVFVSAALAAGTRDILDGPAIETKGFVYVDESGHLIDEALDLATDIIHDSDEEMDLYDLERELKGALTKLFRSRTGRRPLVLPVLFEVGGNGDGNGLDGPQGRGTA